MGMCQHVSPIAVWAAAGTIAHHGSQATVLTLQQAAFTEEIGVQTQHIGAQA